jgi:hypothetical protein
LCRDSLAVEGLKDAGALCGQDVGGGALCGDAAVVETDDFGVEQEGFFYVVGYGEDWDA